MKIKTLIVDDEPHAIEVIEKYIENFSEIELIGKCNTAMQAFQLLRQHKIDLIFLDVKMPGLTLEELLPEDKFVRIHRSFIVAMNKIESYHSYSIDVLGKELPIGRNYKTECHKRLRVM